MNYDSVDFILSTHPSVYSVDPSIEWSIFKSQLDEKLLISVLFSDDGMPTTSETSWKKSTIFSAVSRSIFILDLGDNCVALKLP